MAISASAASNRRFFARSGIFEVTALDVSFPMFGEEATSLRETLKKVLSSNRHIVLNLAGVTYVDSGGLGTLVGVYSSARAGVADIKLTGLGQRLRDVLQITKLATVFEVYDSEQQAIAAFQRGGV